MEPTEKESLKKGSSTGLTRTNTRSDSPLVSNYEEVKQYQKESGSVDSYQILRAQGATQQQTRVNEIFGNMEKMAISASGISMDQSQSFQEIEDIEKVIERNKPTTNDAIDKMELTGKHPLSVYFQNEDEDNDEEPEEIQGSPPQPIGSPQSFGYGRGGPLSVNTDPEFNQSPDGQKSHRDEGRHYSGVQTMMGSIEQSPNRHISQNQSYGPRNAFSSLNSQMESEAGSGAQIDYNFLGGIREVDDDEETLGGQKSASKSSNGKSFGGTFKGSLGSGNGNGRGNLEENKAEHYYATSPPVIDSATNPFIQNLQQQALWSSGKSSSGEFGGGAFGTISEPPLTRKNTSPSQEPESQRIEHIYNRNLITKVYNQALAQMGEKACMRMAMKEIALILDELNQIMCKQAVHQEIMMSEDTGTSQMRQIMDLSLREQKSSAKRRHDRSLDSEEVLDSQSKKLLEGLKKKSNLQLIETLRMDSKMMQIRFDEFMSREGNIYNLYAKERERNEMLQNELLKYENSGNSTDQYGNRSPQPFQNMESYTQSYHKDTIEKAAANTNITINQLSPVSTFMKKQQHQKSMQEGIIHEVNQSYEEESLKNQYLKLLDEKDREIVMLNDFVDNLKKEFQSLRQPDLVGLVNPQHLRSETSSDKRSTLEQQQDKMIQLHTSIYNLKRQNSMVENQLGHAASVQTAPIKNEQIIKLEQELSQLKHDMNETRRLKLSSSPSRKQGDHSTSYQNTGATRAAHQRRVIEEDKQQSRSNSASKKTSGLMIGGQTMEYTSEPSSIQTKRIQGLSHHISEPLLQPQISLNAQQEIKNIQTMADTLNQKLKEVLKRNQELQLKEKHLTEKIQNREVEYAELRVLTRDLQSQATVNSDALDKAGKVIQKLNYDLQQSLDAAAQIQNECERVKQDGRLNRKQLLEMEQTLKNQQEANEAKIQRINNELNLEISQLKEALSQYQNDQDQEKIELQYHIEELQSQLSNQRVIQQSMEAKMLADSQAFKDQLNKKNVELLSLQDQKLSMQIQMSKLEDQVEQDIDVRDQLNLEQNTFLKNQINDLTIRLNSQTQTLRPQYKNENKSHLDQDGEVLPKINESYLTTLNKEFTLISNELQKLRSILSSHSISALDSFLAQHTKQFDSFKLNVLDNLIDWHQKVNELSRLANKYYDTLEEYKMLFVQMKQVIKEKDMMVRNMSNHIESVQKIQQQKYSQMNCSLLDANNDTMANLKDMTRVLEHKIKVKESEVEELLKYQEEFRQEYLRTCDEKEALFHDNQALLSKVEHLDGALQHHRKLDHEYKEKLRTSLEIQEGPYQYDVVVQHVESIMESNKAQKLQIRHYQEKCDEITLEIENQRQIFQHKMSDMEKQLEDSQKQFIDQQDDAQAQFLNKELDLEKQISELTTDLDKANHEIQLRERQMRKHESKVEDEIEKQKDLQKTIDSLIEEQKNLKEANEAVKQTYDLLQEKLKETQSHLDAKVERVDQMDFELKQAYNRIDKLEVDLYNQDNQNKERLFLNEKLQKQTSSDIQTLHMQSKKLRELEELVTHLQKELDMTREAEANLQAENLEQKGLLRDMNTQSQTISYQSDEIKKYQDSIAYLSRQIDEQTLAQLDIQLLQKEKQHLEHEIDEKESYINKYVHYPRASVSVQTSTKAIVELELMSQEVFNLNQHVEEILEEQEQLREAMRRQMNDIDRLIEEKRQLEREVDQKNAKIYHLQHKESTYASENIDITNARRRSNSPDNSGYSHKIGHFASRGNLDMVLSEKQSYINKLELELNDMRVENEKLKDKVIVFELENLGSKSLNQTNTQYQTTLPDSQMKYSGHKFRGHNKNYTQKVGFAERPPRFEKTQQTATNRGQPQSSFDRSLNFGLTSYQNSRQKPDNQRPQKEPEYYTLNQSANEEQMTPYLVASDTENSHRKESPMRAAQRRFPNISQNLEKF